ncbi:hypothetical protein TNCV_2430121 [Trichonephila clavipes]|nr:hypothetical protein TNCV_2430121 [Trichonephila clavipes]
MLGYFGKFLLLMLLENHGSMSDCPVSNGNMSSEDISRGRRRSTGSHDKSIAKITLETDIVERSLTKFLRKQKCHAARSR